MKSVGLETKEAEHIYQENDKILSNPRYVFKTLYNYEIIWQQHRLF